MSYEWYSNISDEDEDSDATRQVLSQNEEEKLTAISHMLRNHDVGFPVSSEIYPCLIWLGVNV